MLGTNTMTNLISQTKLHLEDFVFEHRYFNMIKVVQHAFKIFASEAAAKKI